MKSSIYFIRFPLNLKSPLLFPDLDPSLGAMEQLIEIGVFAAKWVIVVTALGTLVVLVLVAAGKARQSADLEVEDVNQKFIGFRSFLGSFLFNKKQQKQESKKLKKNTESKALLSKPRLFVLEFNGDIQATQVEELREEVDAVLSVAAKGDKVLVRVESPGGTVHGYGLAAAQLLRLKRAELEVIAAVDRVAASGGYLMACTASRIIAAPFAILGSIGVVAQVPNIHRLLKKHEIDYEEITSGEYKRTVSVLGEITEKGRQKFTQQIEDTHSLFKDFVSKERPQLNVDAVSTGEYWFGFRAHELKLVDEIQTSDEYVFSARETHRILKVNMKSQHGLAHKLKKFMSEAKSELGNSLLGRFFNPRI